MYDSEWFEGKRLEKLHERCFWRRVGFAVFIGILAIGATVLMMYPRKANAANLVSRNAGDSVRLYAKPCTTKASLDRIKPEYHKRFQQGEAELGGKRYPMCWVALDSGFVLMIYEDGETGHWPMDKFEKEEGV